MIDITFKSSTLRKAIAQAIVKVSSPETILAVQNKTVPKGDVLEMAKTAGLFAAKRTADMIPDCHPLPIEFTGITYEFDGLEIKVLAEIHTIYKTGVEVEAMHAASVVALTMYDMLKPIDKGISIEQIKLIQKKGGKSDFGKLSKKGLKAAILVCSDSISVGENKDVSGKVIRERLEKWEVEVASFEVIPDELTMIREHASQKVADGIDLLIISGGTGVSLRDVTPEAIEPLLDKRIPGIEEAIRTYGQQRMPYAMLSRSVAGLIGETLVLALPGSVKGVEESMDAVFPAVLHVFKVLEGKRHD